MKDHALQEIMNHSIKIEKGTEVVWPLQGGRVGALNMFDVIKKYAGRSVFAVNNSVIGFIYKGKMYITPYTREYIEALIAVGFEEDYFYVPCSNGDLPRKNVQRWEELKRLAKETYAEDFEGECLEYSDAHRIHELPDDVLEKCLKIPDEGMKIVPRGIKINFKPFLSKMELFDDSAKAKIGRYHRSKNLIAFVYCDGSTYLARGWWMLKKLNDSGYQCTRDFFVPDSLKPSDITDPSLRAKFALLPDAL